MAMIDSDHSHWVQPSSDDILPQHDLDERKKLGREIGLENIHRSQWAITQKGRDALRESLTLDAAMQPLLSIEANLRKQGHLGDTVAEHAAEDVWRSIVGLQMVIGELVDHGR